MDVYVFLVRPGEIRKQIQLKRETRLQLLMSLYPGAIRYDKDKVQTTPQDKMSDIMAQIDDLDSDIDYLKDQLRSSRREIAGLCDQYLDDQETRIVKLRHIDGLKWDDVARAVHRSERTVHRIHKSAVDKLKEYKI